MPFKRLLFFAPRVAFVLLVLPCLGGHPARAGGPLVVRGTFGPDGQAFTWDPSLPVQYRTDGGNLGLLTNAQANARVEGMFQVWQDVPTASITYSRAGQLLPTGVFVDGDVNTVGEFDAVEGSCQAGAQSPIVYDVDGSLFAALGFPSAVIGFAGPCSLSPAGRIVSGEAVLNGRFQDGSVLNGELTPSEFDGAFIHEFGHFSGLDHSQINDICFLALECTTSRVLGLPTMFPVLLRRGEAPGVNFASTLAVDDIAWISRLYPDASFSSNFGTISGTVFFSDGITGTQGVNVIARRLDDPATGENEGDRFAVSVVSGYFFTGNPGQNVTGTNPGSSFGSRNPSLIGSFEIPLPPGNYTVQVESINQGFFGGSSVGPVDPPIRNPGPNETWNLGESAADNTTDSNIIVVTPGGTVSGINIILNGTPPRFDQFEDSGAARLWWREPAPPPLRQEHGNLTVEIT